MISGRGRGRGRGKLMSLPIDECPSHPNDSYPLNDFQTVTTFLHPPDDSYPLSDLQTATTFLSSNTQHGRGRGHPSQCNQEEINTDPFLYFDDYSHESK